MDMNNLDLIASQSAQIATQAAELVANHTFFGVSLGEILGSVFKVQPTGIVGNVANHTFFAASLKNIISATGTVLGGIFK